MTAKEIALKDLCQIPGVGKSLATDLWNIGITSVEALKNNDPGLLYQRSNEFAGVVQDRCVLYVFRCAVYFANTEKEKRESEKMKWWNWKDESRILK